MAERFESLAGRIFIAVDRIRAARLMRSVAWTPVYSLPSVEQTAEQDRPNSLSAINIDRLLINTDQS